MEEGEKKKTMKGKVCVTGGTGFVASWLIMRLLQHGYSVNTTIRTQPQGSKKDISYLTNLPSAPEKLRIFNADIDNPESFESAMEGCVGVFHLALPMALGGSEESITEKSVRATLAILEACLKSKTVKRVVYTSSASTVMMKDEKGTPEVLDEGYWSDLDYIRKSKTIAAYCISKILTEKASLEFAEKHALDLVTVIPSWILGPFVCPNCPRSVKSSLSMLIGNNKGFKYYESTPFVHTDDVASAQIFLFEHPEAKGRYICSAVEISTDKLSEFLTERYPEFEVLSADSLTDADVKIRSLSSKKLLGTGFRYKYGLQEMFDEAIECCRQKGCL